MNSPVSDRQSPSVLRECWESVGDICNALVTAAQGLLVTGRYGVTPSENVTMRYPQVKREIAGNFRGRLLNDMTRCHACGLCVRACPTGAIAMSHETGADKKRIVKNYSIDMTICLYCGLCCEACSPTTRNAAGDKCLTMQGGYEYSHERKETIAFAYRPTEEDLSRMRAEAEARAATAAAAAAPTPTPAPAAASAPASAAASAPAVVASAAGKGSPA